MKFSFVLAFWFPVMVGLGQTVPKEANELCKLRNQALEKEVSHYEEVVKKQHEENVELKKRIQSHQPVTQKTYEEDFKKAKLALPKLIDVAKLLELNKQWNEALEIYTSISNYFPGTYEAFLANQRIPDIILKTKKK